MSAACVRANMLAGKGQPEAVALADTFCREARLRVDDHFRNLYGPNDANLYRLAMSVLKGEHAWLEHGIAAYGTEMGLDSPAKAVHDAPRATERADVLAGVR